VSLAVAMEGISKRFGAVQALEAVDLHVESGTLHAVVGENGAGKTTLMRILYGALKQDEGMVAVAGKAAAFRSSADAIDAGIGMVSQHYGIIPELTCLQNLILGAEGGAVIDLRAAEARAQELATRMGFEFDWEAEASTLSPAGAQKLEILKLLWRNARIMILDEPTAMLSPADGEALFASLRKLVDAGATVVLVTHRLPEVLNHCSRVTVLRGGKRVAEKAVAETNAQELATLIVGGAVAEPPPLRGTTNKPILLTVKDLKVRGARGEEALKGVSLELREGEILGIAGVDGSGQRELFAALLGLTKLIAGTVGLDGADIGNHTPAWRLREGFRVIPEDRHEEGLIEDWSLAENAGLGMQREGPFARGKWVDIEARRAAATAIAERFNTRHGGVDMPMQSLSGGNQQRFVGARALYLNPKVILAFQPARGLDINGTEDVYRGIREACDQGAGALVVNFDLDELLAHCDRLVAMNRGEILEPPAGQGRDRDVIGRLMVGAV
jgi:general nucleoside transport system ATP-binding protein